MKRPLILAAGAVIAITSRDAAAFCGFYVAPSDAPLYADATLVALMREGTRTALTMSNNYRGPLADFAMVVPVPVVLNKADVRTLSPKVFERLETLTAPRLVEYWEEDPCYEEPVYDSKSGGTNTKFKGAGAIEQKKDKDYGVTIEAQFNVDEYDIVVLGATESDGLERWLIDNRYKVPAGASAVLAPYIKEQMKFFVAKVDASKVKKDDAGVVVLSPLRFHYESTDFRLPVRLGLLNSSGKQDLIVFTLSKKDRYETANYPNVFIPTNVDVTDATRSAFGPFYASLFDATLEKAGGRAVVTEYSWISTNCDPCPVDPLPGVDVADLGGEVLLDMKKVQAQAAGSTEVWVKGAVPVVITRLHARYDAKTLTEDLVFRAAAPVVGGREFLQKSDGTLERGATPSLLNQFQARYAIRHPWVGEIACENPRRGRWGGDPPPNRDVPAGPVAATKLAAAPRDRSFRQFAVSRIDELGVRGRLPGTAPDDRGGMGPMKYFLLGFLLGGLAIVFFYRSVARGMRA